MPDAVTPMIHVPDVRATAEWYASIGFAVDEMHDDGEDVVFAIVSFGAGRVMLSAGGRPSDAPRREVDLYVETDRVEALYDALKDHVEVVEPVHDTFYGMREFIIRDVNRFWITFGRVL